MFGAKPVTLELGGTARVIRLGFNVTCAAEAAFGGPILMGIEAWSNARLLRALVWAALQTFNEDGEVLPRTFNESGELLSGGPTIMEVGDWIDEAGVETVLGALMTAWADGMPEAEDDSAEDPPPPEEGSP